MTSKFVLEIKNIKQKLCGKPADIYPTNYESLYVAVIGESLDTRSGRKLGKEWDGATQLLESVAPTENNAFAKPYAYEPKHTFHKTSDENMYLNMDYEMHMGTKLEYLLFQSSRLLHDSEIQLVKNQCEQERTHILTILMLSLENPRLSGFMVTGNRSMFLETDGSLAWLYHYPLVLSPLHRMNQCYDRIPILYGGQIEFVDPITQQTHSNLQNCIDRNKNLSIRRGPRRVMVYFDTGHRAPRQTGCVCAQRCFTSSSSCFSWISRCWNVH